MKKFYLLFFLLFLSFFFYKANAQIVNFSFAGSDGDEGSWPSSAEANGIQSCSMSRGPGVTAIANADRFNSKNWTTSNVPDLDDYIEFTITPKPGVSVTVSTITLQHQRSLTGPKSFVIRTSHNDFAGDATNTVSIPDVNVNQTSTFNFSSVITTLAPLVIRIYAYNAEAANGTWGPGESMDGNDLAVSGSFLLLPVKFIAAKAFWRSQHVEVEWANATESDVQQYIVERSADGRNFTELKNVLPLKNNGGYTAYTITDLQPATRINYYRIKAVETSGHIFYSSVLKVTSGFTASSISIYPNPVAAGSQFMLQTNGLAKGNYQVVVYNYAAQIVSAKTISIDGGSSSQAMELRNLAKGSYVLEIRGEEAKHLRFVVQ